MPIHDWTRVDAGLFHAFHQQWISALCQALNTGGLPPGYFALPEQRIRGPIPDVLALHLSPDPSLESSGAAGLVVAIAPPRAPSFDEPKPISTRTRPIASRSNTGTARSSL